METLFDPASYGNVLRRVEMLQPGSPRQWGTMTSAQMLEHVARALAMAAGTTPSTQRFLGKMIAWIFKKGFVGPTPFPKNSPTGPDFVIQGDPDFDATKAKVKSLLSDFHALGERGCDGNVHGFFGRLTGAEWGVTQYKHLDHHLRQFGV